MQKKIFDKEFEFALNKEQKSHLINKSNNLSISGAEYVRLLIDRDLIIDELINITERKRELVNRLSSVQNKLRENKKNGG